MSKCKNVIYYKDLCRKHYKEDCKNRLGGIEQICKYPHCKRPHHAKGYCYKHYKRLWRTGSTERINNTQGPCSVKGCEDLGYGNPRLCGKHRHRYERYGDPTKLAKDFPKKRIPCSVPTCKNTVARVITRTEDTAICARHANMYVKYEIKGYEFIDIFGNPPYHCYLCGDGIDINSENIQIDHIISKYNGGKDTPENLSLTHKTCNQAKGKLSKNEFINLCKKITAWNST